MSSSSSRATRTPLLMSKLPSSSGSLISPFQPTVVRGFSKYTRMTISRSALRRSRTGFRRLAYSMARVSWIEQGRSRRSCGRPCRAGCGHACRAANTVSDASLVQANSRMKCAGGFSSLISRMRRSSVLCDTVLLLGCPPGMVPGCLPRDNSRGVSGPGGKAASSLAAFSGILSKLQIERVLPPPAASETIKIKVKGGDANFMGNDSSTIFLTVTRVYRDGTARHDGNQAARQRGGTGRALPRRPDPAQAVPPTVRPSMRTVGMPTPTGTLWPSLPQVPTPESSFMSLPISVTRFMASGPLPIRVAPLTG